jgi:hypothetical protein
MFARARVPTSGRDMVEDRAEAWLRAKREAAARLNGLVEPELAGAARRSWGRGFFRPPWQIVRRPDDVVWRAYHYLGTAADEDHRYFELGITAHLDPEGRLVGFGVDNGGEFLGLHDTSAYGLQRGLEYMRQQRPRVRAYASPQYDHPLKPFKS